MDGYSIFMMSDPFEQEQKNVLNFFPRALHPKRISQQTG